MDSYFGTAADLKNIGLAKIVFDLRQDIDLHNLFAAKWNRIDEVFGTAGFFPQIRRRVLGGVVLGICKIYEVEGPKYPLNSIDGILKRLKREKLPEPSYRSKIKDFAEKHGAIDKGETAVALLEECLEKFKGKYTAELEGFKEARDKMVAHSEFLALDDKLPSSQVMENLFEFAAGFYEVVCECFVGVRADDLRGNQPAMTDCVRLFEKIGI